MRINRRDFIITAIIAAVMILFTAPPVMAVDKIIPGGKGMSTTRSELEALVIRVSWILDKGNGEGFAALFTENGIWEQPRGTSNGRGEIEALFAAHDGSAEGIARRVITNFIVLEEKGDRARGEAIMLAFAGAGPGPYSTNITLVLDCNYDFKREADGVWRFQKLAMKVAFGTLPQLP